MTKIRHAPSPLANARRRRSDQPRYAASAAGFDDLIRRLHDVLGLSVLIITHDLDTLVTVCDRIAMIVDKKVVTGTFDDMMRSDKREVRQFFCGPRAHMAVWAHRAGRLA